MAGYLGNKPKLSNYTVDEFTTSSAQASSGNFTLSQTVTDLKTLEISVGGIDQPQSAYSVSGTTLAFGANIVTLGDIVIARHAGESISYPSLEDGAVTAAKMATNAVDSANIIAGAVDNAHLATGISSSKLTGALPALDGSALTSITHTPADNSVTLAKMAPGTDGQIITYDASGDPVAIGPGTAGQVLTSAGANLPQTFADAGGGAWTYISTVVASTASTVDFFALATSTYDVFACFFSGVHPSVDADVRFRMQEAGGPSVDTGGIYYGFVSTGNNNGNTVIGKSFAAATAAIINNPTVDNWSGGTCDGVMYVSQMHRTSTRPSYWGHAKITGNDSSMGASNFGGSSANADAQGFSGFQWLTSSGTISGTFRLYGLTKS